MPTKLSDKCLSWASILDQNTLEQATLAATMPFVSPHLALMPDAHLGKGATVGSVIPTDGALMPAAVGVDIGCGMNAVRTPFTVDHFSPVERRAVRLVLEDVIQLGHGRPDGRHRPDPARVAALESEAASRNFDPDRYGADWRGQLGSLGGGNHFIELVADESDAVWLFLHSGSRGIGNTIARSHIKRAQELNRKWHVVLPDPDLAYLVDDDPAFWLYWHEMQWAQKYAWENRAEMMDRFRRAVADVVGVDWEDQDEVHCHHNYTTKENHFGRNLYVTRKGAIDAHEGKAGLIPGSMGAASYVVTGKGNRASVCSAPHGAGRQHSRKSAKANLDFERQVKVMTERGTEWSGSRSFLDEHPDAYKPIDHVMSDAADLVKVEHAFRALVNVKGA